MTPNDALLALIAELRMQLSERDERIASLNADIVDLRRHLDECPANQEPQQ